MLLAPANTVVKPAEHEFVHHPSLLREAQQGFQLNLESKTTMTGCVAKRTYPQFLVTVGLLLSTTLLGSQLVRRSDSVRPSPLRPRGSAQVPG